VCLHEHYLLYCLRSFLLYDQIAQSPRSLHDYGTSVVHLEMVFLSVLNEAQISLWLISHMPIDWKSETSEFGYWSAVRSICGL
jgi:hypothetical protein